jgi:triosephosphate isomerase
MHPDRRPLVAGNWKMNGLSADGLALAGEIAVRTRAAAPVIEILVCPPATLLAAVVGVVAGSGVKVGGQDCHAEPKGPHTGDISAEMLVDLGCSHVIVGHSERRAGHAESDAVVRDKAKAALRAGLIPIVCVGETRAQRDTGNAAAVVERQIQGSLPEGVGSDRLVVAYEPVWAIGTGLTATAADVAAMHLHIRGVVGGTMGGGLRILYGGSVKPENAAELLALEDVDGALVGGASLNADQFWAIVSSCRWR